jgi:hypothetical protein
MKNNKQIALAMLLTLGASLALISPVSAFDTGHHSDLTREALSDFGFSDNAIRMGQLENWLVDYYSSQPIFPGLESDLAKLHFDALDDTAKVRNYWGNLTVNTQRAITQAATENNPKKVLALIGMSLHAVQDFYTHSNWVETQPAATGNAFRTRTWFDANPGLRLNVRDISTIKATDISRVIETARVTDIAATTPATAPAVSSASLVVLRTGTYPNHDPIVATDHGNYDAGMNHDSYNRPRWDEAYVYAYSGSRQWVGAIEQWVNAANPGLWAQVRNIALTGQESGDLGRDLVAAYRISEWIRTPSNNGHWKGKGSGSVGEFATFTTGWMASRDSIYVEHFKNQKWHQALTNGLTGNTAPTVALPTIAPSGALNKTAIIVRTTRIEELPVGFFEQKIDSPGGTADFFANITINGQTFVETMLNDQVNPSPAWHTIKFVPSSQANVAIRYQLVDEDGGLAGDDDICDINPAGNKRELDFTFNTATQSLSGDVSGIHNNDGSAVVSAGGQSDHARIRFFVTTRPL